jgi:hypothetical protein
LSSDDEDTQSGRPDVTSDQNGPAADDTGDKGTTSAETLVPGPIGTDVPGKPKLSVTDRASVKPPADAAERSKGIAPKPSGTLAMSSVATASASSPSATIVKGRVGLMACNYASVKYFAQQLLQYLESLKNMEVEREGNRFHSFSLYCNFVSLVDFLLHICVALTANLEAANKVLAKEKASR